MRYCHSFRADGTNFGRCPSKKETYFGFKVHALITLEGYITAFEVTPVSVDDREGLRDLAEKCFGLVILGDKGYTGEGLFDDMSRKGICLMSLKPSNYKKNWPTEIRQVIFRFRRRVENSIFHTPCDIGRITSLRFRFRDKNSEIITITIEKILSTDQDRNRVGIHFSCTATLYGTQKKFTLWYSYTSHEWRMSQLYT